MKQSLLAYYGECIATYTGKGILTLLDNRTAQCSFEVGQLKAGKVILVCDFSSPPPYFPISSAQSFTGVTDESLRISTAGQIIEINDLTNDFIDLSNIRLAFYVSEIAVQIIADKPVRQVQFGVTNLILDKPLTLTLQDATRTATLSMQPVDEHKRVMRRVETLRAIEVTCEVHIPLSEKEEAKVLEDIMNNLCCLLSVAQGTKIQWIYSFQYDETGTLLFKQHDSKVTKACGPLSLIPIREIKPFLEKTYNSYVTNREKYKLAQRLIDAYLDAKAETDYLQMRGIKLAVVMEMLKDVLLHVSEVAQGGEFILAEETFLEFRTRIENPLRDLLSNMGVDGSDQDAIFSKIGELNRRSFRPILKSFFRVIGLELSKRDLDLFIECRNSLVHTGRFFSEMASPEVLKKYKVSFDSIGRDEYYFLVSVLDKAYLKLLGYNGPYIERKIQDQVMHDQVLTL